MPCSRRATSIQFVMSGFLQRLGLTPQFAASNSQ
jgi:hypothetical protein